MPADPHRNAPAQPAGPITGHGGAAIAAAAKAHGVDTLWTLSGAHIFPLYDAAVGGREGVAGAADPASAGPLRLVDTRHEATAVFAAEATAKLTRRPGFAAVTAGPGVTNAVSPITSAWFNGSPLVVVGGRAPDSRWGSGALQELDQPPLLAPVTKRAWTCHDPAAVARDAEAAFALAGSAHRGPVFLDVPMDVLFTPATFDAPAPAAGTDRPVDGELLRSVAARIAAARRPVVVLGSDVWMDGAEDQALRFVAETGLPVVANGMGRGLLPPGHLCLVTRARGAAFARADLVVVVGTPLDFRLGYGRFGGQDGPAADVIHIVDAEPQLATHVPLAGGLAGDLAAIFDALAEAVLADPGRQDVGGWREGLADSARAAAAADEALLTSAADPVHPARIYGELRHRLEADAVVIGDGGDFVSFAGRFIEPARPGGWLDPGPYGCLGTGLGYAMAARVARPASQVVLLLGDGAAGFSLMDVDTLVRHGLPVVMVVGNNATWALEKHPMQFLYGYDVAADLRPTRYDEVVRALGGAGETVERPDAIGPALDRAFASGVPYLVNVLTDTAVAYPRSTTGV